MEHLLARDESVSLPLGRKHQPLADALASGVLLCKLINLCGAVLGINFYTSILYHAYMHQSVFDENINHSPLRCAAL